MTKKGVYAETQNCHPHEEELRQGVKLAEEMHASIWEQAIKLQEALQELEDAITAAEKKQQEEMAPPAEGEQNISPSA
ncbi:MAG: hypothetical protein K0Q74_1005 [Gammaproteobacteria bacterium]|nr:hypothetical protein [Gammaproteobacteria bacterium]